MNTACTDILTIEVNLHNNLNISEIIIASCEKVVHHSCAAFSDIKFNARRVQKRSRNCQDGQPSCYPVFAGIICEQ